MALTDSLHCLLCNHEAKPSFRDDKSLKTYFLCPACDLCFLDPSLRLSKADEAAYYHTHRNDIHDARYQQFMMPLVQTVREVVGPGAEGLDFGCGPGPVAAMMLKQDGYHVDCYDPVFAPKAACLEKRFDFIVCSEVVEHFHEPKAEFERLRALLKPQGHLVIMTSLLHENVDFARWHYRRDPTHVAFYSAACFRWIGEQFGFRGVRDNGTNVIVLAT